MGNGVQGCRVEGYMVSYTERDGMCICGMTLFETVQIFILILALGFSYRSSLGSLGLTIPITCATPKRTPSQARPLRVKRNDDPPQGGNEGDDRFNRVRVITRSVREEDNLQATSVSAAEAAGACPT